MKAALAGLGVIFLALFLGLRSAKPDRKAQGAKPGSGRNPVVVELFTSEGCSSCPPADALLARLYKDQPVEGAKVIALEEHVDYWDSLGWKDPFSAFAWTMRQQDYAARFENDGVYTPQMVVDGQAEFVGSREWQSEREIGRGARRAKTAVLIAPAHEPATDGAEKFFIRTGKIIGGTSGDVAEVWLAVAENNLQSSVTRGENAGEHLRHSSVLRSLQKIGSADANKNASFEGSADVRFDATWNRENTRIIVLVQEHRSRKILGAAELPAA